MEWLNPYIKQIEEEVQALELPGEPGNLYEPIRYILELGGKRLRPSILMAVAHAYGARKNISLQAGMAVELFHNFSLLHDEIMDEAPLRRGRETVHRRWNPNIAILSGDAMLVQVYQRWTRIQLPNSVHILQRFNRTALEVCEGQQYDMDFEREPNVTSEQYLEMIRLKTAVLLGFCMEAGALLAQAGLSEASELYRIGESLGLAFQLKDDLLDAFPESDRFGKASGGDIRSGKKTMLYLLALEKASPEDKAWLQEIFGAAERSPDQVLQIKELFLRYEVRNAISRMIEKYHDMAIRAIHGLSASEELRTRLIGFADGLRERTF